MGAELDAVLQLIADEAIAALKTAIKMAAAAVGVTISDDLLRDLEAQVRSLLRPGPGITHAKTLVVDDYRTTT